VTDTEAVIQDPGPDPKAYRRTIGLFATGVTVLAVDTTAGVLAMTANAIASVSLAPLLLLACVEHRARIHGHLVPGQVFSVNVLRADQEVLSRYFAGGWRDRPAPEHRFVQWGGAPRLVGGLAALRCVVHRNLDGGDHTIVLARVAELFEDDAHHNPLIFFAGRYRRLAPMVTPGVAPEQWGPDGASIYFEEWSAEHAGTGERGSVSGTDQGDLA
jgi:flavin reductase (DIM6/NTAB) family NADH-FMN oxidoreductase RutF